MDEGETKMKIVQILGGPYKDDGMFWNVCLIKSGDAMWEEEIYYDSAADALSDFEDLRKYGPIDLEDADYE